MKNLPPEEVARINVMVEQLVNSPLLTPHRAEFSQRLAHTIGGDYKDDRDAADAEFQIAVWRATVYLLHHTNYSYRCNACQSSTYLTQRARPKIFDRRYPVCPNCNRVRISDQGNSPWPVGSFVLMPDIEQALRSGQTVSYDSPVEPLKGDRKVADHDLVLDDDEQLGKFYSEFIWNYFRQTLRENEIKHHQMDGTWIEGASGKQRFLPKVSVAGPADKIAVEEVLSVLAGVKFPHTYQAGANPHDGAYHIQADLDCADAALVEQLTVLVAKYERLKVRINITDRGAYIRVATKQVATVEALVIKPQVVALVTGAPRIGDDAEDYASVIDTNHHRIVGGKTMQEDGIAKLEAEDLLKAIHDSLPDDARKVLEIYTQTGETWQRFSMPDAQGLRPTTDRPPPAQIARFLGVSPKQVKQWISDIKIQCLAHDLTPG